MQTETKPAVPTGATISEAAYAARQDALDKMPTAALLQERCAIASELADAGQHGSGEDEYTLLCLLDWADAEIEARRNGYTGQLEK